MTAATFKVRALARVGLAGDALEPGQIVAASAIDAKLLVSMGRAELVDPRDTSDLDVVVAREYRQAQAAMSRDSWQPARRAA